MVDSLTANVIVWPVKPPGEGVCECVNDRVSQRKVHFDDDPALILAICKIPHLAAIPSKIPLSTLQHNEVQIYSPNFNIDLEINALDGSAP